MKRFSMGFLFVSISAGLSACGGGDSSSRSTPSAPTPTVVSLRGTVSVTGGSRVANATIAILDGVNAGKSAITNSNGEYTFDGLTVGNGNLSANATIYDEVIRGVYINGTNTLDFVFPIPSCQSNNTAQVRFGNRHPSLTQYVMWDGINRVSLAAGATSEYYTTAAGVAHSMEFRREDTRALACSTGYPVLTQCEKATFTCSGPSSVRALGFDRTRER